MKRTDVTYTLLFRTYQVLRTVRYGILSSVFGATIHCKHSPTCGTYLFKSIEEKGVVTGSLLGFKRILTCW